jgi:hypothetical protein
MGNLSLGDTTTVRPLGRMIVWDGIWSAIVSAARAALPLVNASRIATSERHRTSRGILVVMVASKCASAALSVITRMCSCPH